MLFHSSLVDGKSPQVSRTVPSIPADLNSAVVWIVLILSLSKWFLNRSLQPMDRTLTDITTLSENNGNERVTPHYSGAHHYLEFLLIRCSVIPKKTLFKQEEFHLSAGVCTQPILSLPNWQAKIVFKWLSSLVSGNDIIACKMK